MGARVRRGARPRPAARAALRGRSGACGRPREPGDAWAKMVWMATHTETRTHARTHARTGMYRHTHAHTPMHATRIELGTHQELGIYEFGIIVHSLVPRARSLRTAGVTVSPSPPWPRRRLGGRPGVRVAGAGRTRIAWTGGPPVAAVQGPRAVSDVTRCPGPVESRLGSTPRPGRQSRMTSAKPTSSG